MRGETEVIVVMQKNSRKKARRTQKIYTLNRKDADEAAAKEPVSETATWAIWPTPKVF
jgi:hypothetical protein